MSNMINMIEVTDFNAPQLDVYARLTEGQLLNRHEPQNGMFIAESPKVIERALDAGCVPVSILMEKKHAEGQGREIIRRCGGIPVYTAASDVLTQLTGFKLTRGMLCAMRRPAPRTVSEVCAGARRIAVLENVMNPTNVGASARHGRDPADAGGQRSSVPSFDQSQHGNRLSDTMGISG